ncbi:FAD-dependent oxidoreductase [Methylococcus sp. EFPC2]|uniref:FAD-dependent oxidoreductase n=1 Tax=Methylococcus sp. EFPC2 TaxID=2812648 RepID=UPI001967D36C|nr:GMC family oxidoreductase [Methylococcus sp. EFPC2]QSA95777.1 GMC family oxidoreductase [Methylococcus sp. EFPC2]
MIYDYLVIGSGAGGSAAAYRLAETGRSVLLVEKGEALPTDGSTLDFRQVMGDGRFKSRENWLDRKNRPFAPEEYFNLGGKTKWYGAALLRFDPREFEADPAFRCPAWPIAYPELEPWYAQAEELLGLREFPVEPDLLDIQRKIERPGGWRSRPLPLALKPEIREYEAEARHFDGFASLRGLKADGQNALLARVAQRDTLTVTLGRPVRELLGDDADPRHIVGVRLADGQVHRADQILLAAGALHSPRLLQRYLAAHDLIGTLPGTRSVGRHFKRHILTALVAVSPTRKTDVLRKTALWLHEDFPHGSIQPLGFGADVLASLLPHRVPRPLALAFGTRAYGFFLQTEDGSHADNRVLAEAGGRPPQLDYDTARLPEAEREHGAMVKSFRRALFKAGYPSVTRPIPLAGTAHACGTLVSGDDPARSAVDRHGKVHGLENLYVADGSILPRIGRVNPALTIYAWALRLADHLIAGPMKR